MIAPLKSRTPFSSPRGTGRVCDSSCKARAGVAAQPAFLFFNLVGSEKRSCSSQESTEKKKMFVSEVAGDMDAVVG